MLPYSRDFTATDGVTRFPPDTMRRLQCGVVDHQQVLTAERSAYVSAAELRSYDAHIVAFAGYLYVDGVDFVAAVPNIPIGARITGWSAWVRETSSTAISGWLRKYAVATMLEGALAGGPAEQTTPGTSAGDVTLSEDLDEEGYVTVSTFDRWYLRIHSQIAGDRVYGVRFDYLPELS